jgi:hypothetical protein
MNWRVVVRPEAGVDVEEAAAWYDSRDQDFTLVPKVSEALWERAALPKLCFAG